MNQQVERLKEIKETMATLTQEKEAIEATIDDTVICQNQDGTWTRFTKIDAVEELKKGTFFRLSAVNRFSTKLEILKNPPKELTGVNK